MATKTGESTRDVAAVLYAPASEPRAELEAAAAQPDVGRQHVGAAVPGLEVLVEVAGADDRRHEASPSKADAPSPLQGAFPEEEPILFLTGSVEPIRVLHQRWRA